MVCYAHCTKTALEFFLLTFFHGSARNQAVQVSTEQNQMVLLDSDHHGLVPIPPSKPTCFSIGLVWYALNLVIQLIFQSSEPRSTISVLDAILVPGMIRYRSYIKIAL